jgi:prepilin-type N-terminal cleavage/methylation domain-containing protein
MPKLANINSTKSKKSLSKKNSKDSSVLKSRAKTQKKQSARSKKSLLEIVGGRTVFGFTLIEVIVATAIVALLTVVTVRGVSGYLARSRDTQRKADMQEIKIAFEDFYGDNQCYPKQDILMDCGADTLAPYLKTIPCDPTTGLPYLYDPYPSATNTCRGFRVYTDLEQDDDPAVEDLDCDGPVGCGAQASSELTNYNYGVSVGVALSQKDVVITSGAAATLLESGFTCSSGGICNVCQFVSANPGEQCPQGNTYISVQDCETACK